MLTLCKFYLNLYRMNYKIFYLFIIFIIWSSCGPSTPSKPSNPVENKPQSQAAKAEKGTALSILEFRLQNEPNTSAIIEADTWEYQSVFSEGKMSQPGAYNGVWIDFKADHTYAYGSQTTLNGSGRYHFSSDNNLVLMIDNDPAKKVQEFEAKFAGDVMVLVGTRTYNDNSIQMKLNRIPDSTFPH